jgi:hypothetical protein
LEFFFKGQTNRFCISSSDQPFLKSNELITCPFLMRSALAFPLTVVQSVGLFTKTTSLAKFVHGFIEVDAEDLWLLLFRERLLARVDEPIEEPMELNEATVPPRCCP